MLHYYRYKILQNLTLKWWCYFKSFWSFFIHFTIMMTEMMSLNTVYLIWDHQKICA
jgi:hypothetical protein